MFDLFSPLWKVSCADETGLNFSVYLRAPGKSAVAQRVKAKGWIFRSAVKESIIQGMLNSRKDISYVTSVPIKSMISFYRQMANMYGNAVPLAQAVRICGESTEVRTLQMITARVASDLEGGSDLASAMAKFPNIFDRKTAITIRAAQSGGYLDKALASLAREAELSHDINKKLNGAMIYPTSIIIVAIVAVLVFAFKVIPNFKPLYSAIGMGLPFPTRMMLALSVVLTKYPFLAVIAVAAPIYVFVRKRQIFTKPFWQTLFVHLPMVKGLAISLALSRYARMISQLTAASIPFPTQVAMLRESSIVPAYRRAWETIAKDLGQGMGFTAALEKHKKLLSHLFVGNIRVGEQSGTIAESAGFVADFFEGEVRDIVKNMNAIVEPLLIVFIGLVVGFLLFAMFLPLFDITQLVKG